MSHAAYYNERPDNPWLSNGLRMIFMPPKHMTPIRGVAYFFGRLAFVISAGLFCWMAAFELLGPAFGNRAGPAGGVFGNIVGMALVVVPFLEAFGLYIASLGRKWPERTFMRLLWLMAVVSTFTGHLYLVAAVNDADRVALSAARESDVETRNQADAMVATGVLEAQLVDQSATVTRAATEHARLLEWRPVVAASAASRTFSEQLRGIQVEVSARRQARGEAPLSRADGMALAPSDCAGICGETAEAVEREIGLAATALREAEAARDATSAAIQDRIDREAAGDRLRTILQANAEAETESTTKSMTSFMMFYYRIKSMVDGERHPMLDDPTGMEERAANLSDLAFFWLLALVNLASAGLNNTGHEPRRGEDEAPPRPATPLLPHGTRPPPIDLVPGPSGAYVHPSAAVPHDYRPPPRPAAGPPPGRSWPFKGAPAPKTQRPEPDAGRLSAESRLQALRAKVNS